jgi:hypothetical protein
MCEQEVVGAFNDSFGFGSVGRQTITFAATVPRNAWHSAVSSARPPRHRPIAHSPSHTNTRGAAPKR